MTVRQTFTAPLAGALQSAFAGGGLFGLFHEGGIVGEAPAPRVSRGDGAYDAVVLPTTPNMAPKVERLLAEGDFHGAENLLALPNTHFANLMDEPALSLPSGPPGSA